MVVMGGSRLADSMTMSVFFPVVREEAQSRGEVETRAASSERAVDGGDEAWPDCILRAIFRAISAHFSSDAMRAIFVQLSSI